MWMCLFILKYINIKIIYFREMSLSQSEKMHIEDSLSEQNIAKLLLQIQTDPVLKQKVNFRFIMLK